MASVNNGYTDSPPDLHPEVLKVVVIGEPICGKTSFIRKFHENNFPDDPFFLDGAKVYPCEFEVHPYMRKVAIFKMPCGPEFSAEQRKPLYEKADIFVFMHAFDDPLTFHMLIDKWMPEATNSIHPHQTPLLLVGTKLDLRNDPQVIERLALENKSPITDEEICAKTELIQSGLPILTCSSNNEEQVEATFKIIFERAMLYE